MAVTAEQVRAVLDDIEPDYDRVPAMGRDALPHLATLVDGGDPRIAPKAAYAASLLGDEYAAEIVERAARSPEPTVRVAAAAALRNLEGEHAARPLRRLLGDDDTGVRLKALRSMPAI